MKRTMIALLAIGTLAVNCANAQPARPASNVSPRLPKPEALPDGTFMYCDPVRAYYPVVRDCPADWRIVTQPLPAEAPLAQRATPARVATPVSSSDTINPGCAGLRFTSPNSARCQSPAPEPDEARNSGATTAEEKSAGAKVYENCLSKRPSGSMPGSGFVYASPQWAGYRQKWRDKCDQAERDAVIQFRRQSQAQAQAQAAADTAQDRRSRAIAKAESRGYELIPSVKDLVLDGKELATRNTKVQITAFYRKVGGNAALYSSQMEAYQVSDRSVPVLIEDASRPVREALMSYGCESQLGCLVNVGGHMTLCHHLNALMAGYPDVPCLNIEVQIVYRPGD